MPAFKSNSFQVVGTLIAAAYVVDYIDAELGIKESVAGYAR